MRPAISNSLYLVTDHAFQMILSHCEFGLTMEIDRPRLLSAR